MEKWILKKVSFLSMKKGQNINLKKIAAMIQSNKEHLINDYLYRNNIKGTYNQDLMLKWPTHKKELLEEACLNNYEIYSKKQLLDHHLKGLKFENGKPKTFKIDWKEQDFFFYNRYLGFEYDQFLNKKR